MRTEFENTEFFAEEPTTSNTNTIIYVNCDLFSLQQITWPQESPDVPAVCEPPVRGSFFLQPAPHPFPLQNLTCSSQPKTQINSKFHNHTSRQYFLKLSVFPVRNGSNFLPNTLGTNTHL